MATAAAILDLENMKFQNLFRLRDTQKASVLHNDRFLALRDPRWPPWRPSCPKPSLCDGLKSPWMIVLKFYMVHSQTTGQLSLFVSGMLESKMAAVMTILDWENLGFLWWAMRGIHMSTAGVDFS